MVEMTGSRRGMVLLTCLLLLTLLITLYYRYSREVVFQARLARNVEHAFHARLAAKAGLHAALNLLDQDDHIVDHYGEDWFTVASKTWEDPIILGPASVSFRIVDEAAKLNVNLADEATLIRLFETYRFGITASSSLLGEEIRLGASSRLAQRILDYRDADDSPLPDGLEREGYPDPLNRPPRNGPLRDLRELLNIPGITAEMFAPPPPRVGLADLLTVYGQGEINVNTVSPEVLQALPPPSGYSRARFREFEASLRKNLPLKGAGGLLAFVSKFDAFMDRSFLSRLVAFSLCFRIESVGFCGGVTKRMHALVVRDRLGLPRLEWISETP